MSKATIKNDGYMNQDSFREYGDRIYEDPIEQILCSERIEMSNNIDASLFQDSFLWRSALIARLLAEVLIDEDAKLNVKALKRALYILEVKRFSLGEERYHDGVFMNHLRTMLHKIESNEALQYALKRVAKPFSNQVADRLIRNTLHLQEQTLLKEKHAKQAALSALFCRLRQNVGSCFATAPAILIQQEQPEQLLADIAALFGTSRLKRIYEGREYTVPLNTSFGMGDLLKPICINALGSEAKRIFSSSLSFMTAFERAGIFAPRSTKEEKEAQLSLLLKKSGILHRVEESFVVITADEIVRALLLVHFKLKSSDLEEGKVEKSFSPIGYMPFVRGNKVVQRERYRKAYLMAREAFVSFTDNPLLKAWEFTLASLSESRADFAKWNLSASLGLDSTEPHGIGQILHEKIEEKMHALNREIEEMQSKYEHLFLQAKQIESRLSRASSESEEGWLRADYNVRKLEIDHALRQRDEAYEKGSKLRELFTFMLRFYQEQFKEYFQEVYDPEMHDVALSLYDDTPAGFRLLYKHGRSNPSLWTYIYTLDEYSAALSAFFTATEVQLTHTEEVKGVQKELVELVTACVLGIRQEEFLRASFMRLAKAYNEPMIKEPLAHLEQVKRKPWAYVSGGTMTTLLSCYYGLSQPPKEVVRWVESEVELFAFYLDTLKSLPLSVQNRFFENEEGSLLAFSPTHAFMLKPGYELFKSGWMSDRYSYTWIRDDIVNPAAKFLAAIELDREMLAYLTKKIALALPVGYRALVEKKLLEMNLLVGTQQYREEALTTLSYEKWIVGQSMLREIGDQIDAILYESLPFTFGSQLVERVKALCMDVAEIGEEMCAKVQELAQKEEAHLGHYHLISAKELLNITKLLLMRAMGSTRVHFDLHRSLQRAMRRLGYALREPVLFADTNWAKNRFAFCVNPGTLQLELWRCDSTATSGQPLSIWKEHLDGRSKGVWGVLTDPTQYTS